MGLPVDQLLKLRRLTVWEPRRSRHLKTELRSVRGFGDVKVWQVRLTSKPQRSHGTDCATSVDKWGLPAIWVRGVDNDLHVARRMGGALQFLF